MGGAGLRFAARHVEAPLGVVPGRYAVPPPQLPADAPILDFVHPFEIHGGPILGNEADVPRFDGADGGLRERLDVDEPLIGEQGLEDGVAAIAARHGELVRLDSLDESEFLQVGEDTRPCKRAVEAAVRGGHLIVERRVRVHDVDQGQAMTDAHLVIVEVVRRRDLDAAAAELRVDVGVADDGNVARRQRQVHAAADQMPIPFIIGMHGDGGVSQQSLRPRGRHHEEPVVAIERIAQMPQTSRFLLGDHFQIGKRRLQHRIPVHQALAAIDQAFLVEADEDLRHRPRQARVHGESIAPPIDRRAQAPQLLGDLPAGLFLPLPNPLDERIASEPDAAQTRGIQLSFDHHLRGDAGVVGPGLPERVETAHSMVPNERIHDGDLEGMAHVQSAGDIRRRYDDRIGGPSAAGNEISRLFPARVNSRLDVRRREGFIHRLSGLRPPPCGLAVRRVRAICGPPIPGAVCAGDRTLARISWLRCPWPPGAAANRRVSRFRSGWPHAPLWRQPTTAPRRSPSRCR